MSKKNASPPPAPPGSVVLTPTALAFAAAMGVVGLVVGYLWGNSANSALTTAEPASQTAAVATGEVGKGKVINDAGGKIRKLSEAEKGELLSKKKGGDKQAALAPAVPTDSPFLTKEIEAGFEDAVLLNEYKRAVAFMEKQNARSARPLLVKLDQSSAGKSWREPMQALLIDARASVGEFQEARTAAAAFKSEFTMSAFMPRVVVAEGKSYMQQGKRVRGAARGAPPNPEQVGLYKQAIAKFDEAAKSWPADPALASALLSKASLLSEMGDLEGAEKAAVAMTLQFPDHKNAPRALGNVASAAMKVADYDRARTSYQAIIDTFPKDRLASNARSQLSALALLGKDAPELTVEEWLGDDLGTVSDHKGKVVMLVFWATWCPHCRKAMPSIEETYQKYKDDGLVVVGVTRNSRGQTTDKVREYLSENGYTVPIAIDGGESSRAYGVSGIPAAALIDRDGNVVFRDHPAQINDEMLAKYL